MYSLLAKAVFHSRVFLFSLIAHCCFMAILKTSADTNAGQSHRLTHCIENLHRYNLKSLIFKPSLLSIHTFKNTTTFENLFFVRQSLSNAISLPLIYSILSKHFSNFSARKKKTLTLTVQFSPPHPDKAPRQRSNPHPREGLTNQIPHSPGTENGQMPGVCPGGGGGGNVEVLI